MVATIEAEEPFKTVSYRCSKPATVIGRGTAECSIKAVPRRLICFAGRLDIDTSEDLTEYLTEAGVTRVRCTKLKSESNKTFYAAVFRVSCNESSKSVFYDETIWPADVELRDWIFYPKNGAYSYKAVSFNLHGLNNGKDMLHQVCCDNEVHSVATQEHWLTNDKLYLLNSVHSDFVAFAVSGVIKRLASEIYRGRPFGGVGFFM